MAVTAESIPEKSLPNFMIFGALIMGLFDLVFTIMKVKYKRGVD